MQEDVDQRAGLPPTEGPASVVDSSQPGCLPHLGAGLAGLGFLVAALYGQRLLWDAFAGDVRPGWVNPVRVLLALSPGLVVACLLLRRRTRRPRALRIAFCQGAGVLWVLLALFLASPLGRRSLEFYENEREFNAADWRAAAWSEAAANRPGRWPPEDRLWMVDDLLAARRLDGLTREQVRTLLGIPDGANGTGYRVGLSGQWDSFYYLGEPVLPIDSLWLVISFDGTGRVSEYRVKGD